MHPRFRRHNKMKNCMSYMLGLKNKLAYSQDLTVHVRKSFFQILQPLWSNIPYLPRLTNISCQLPKLLFLQIKLSAEPVKYIYNPNRWKLQTLTLSMSTWYMLYLQSITAKVNIKYTKITLDVGAAVNVFKELWHVQKHSQE